MVPEPVTKLLSVARLIALPTPTGDVKPIAIGEIIRRFTAKTTCTPMKEPFGNFFAPVQHGIATDAWWSVSSCSSYTNASRVQ